MEKEVFVWCKKREKRTPLLCEKETRLQQSQKFTSKRFLSLSLSFSHHFFSLSLSLSPPSSRCSFIRLIRESARCAVEADTINERFYSRTFSVIIDDEIIWKKKKKKKL